MPNRFYWEAQDQAIIFKNIWKNYIDVYFNGNENLWHKKSEPYIFYKHLFRKFIYTKCSQKKEVIEVEQNITGKRLHHTTIYNSLNQDPNQFKFTKKQLTEILKFLNDQYSVNQQAKVKRLINEKLERYTTQDVARHCLVHEDAIHNILSNIKVPHYIVTQIKQELS